MLFNSLDFALFLPITFVLYWLVFGGQRERQNYLIVAASYLFYGWWDWRFLSLIAFSTTVDYLIGRRLGPEKHAGRRKALLWASLAVNLGLLGFFKYYNFFLESFVDAFSVLGRPLAIDSLSVVLPVGISFYTFQTLSYTIDVYRGRLEPSADPVAFTAFVSFFPQLVAGPIERATRLLPQFSRERRFDYARAVDGLRQILWGLFKKVVIADNCARFADLIFNSSDDYSGSTLVLGALFFAFQIYGDFAGYSDIAIGTARLFGFDLMQNFNFPYFSRDIAEFWRRWHISLSTWFRDYLYIPLGGSRGGTWMRVRNTFVIFVVSGFWHGANWTFIVWGALNAVYFLPLLLLDRNRDHLGPVAAGRWLPGAREAASITVTFMLTVFAWIFFRAENLRHAVAYVAEIFSPSLLTIPEFAGIRDAIMTVALVLLFMGVEWLGREGRYAIEDLGLRWRRPLRYAMYYAIALTILYFSGGGQRFIYFQF